MRLGYVVRLEKVFFARVFVERGQVENWVFRFLKRQKRVQSCQIRDATLDLIEIYLCEGLNPFASIEIIKVAKIFKVQQG